jgi:hypothetical protein
LGIGLLIEYAHLLGLGNRFLVGGRIRGDVVESALSLPFRINPFYFRADSRCRILVDD